MKHQIMQQMQVEKTALARAIASLEQAYEANKHKGHQGQFTWQGQELLVGYAKFLLEYLKQQNEKQKTEQKIHKQDIMWI